LITLPWPRFWTKQAVEAGLGLGVVWLQAELAARAFVRAGCAGLSAQRQGKRLSPTAQAFAQFVLSEAGLVAPLAELV
jgi:hypothetical protein